MNLYLKRRYIKTVTWVRKVALKVIPAIQMNQEKILNNSKNSAEPDDNSSNSGNIGGGFEDPNNDK